MNIEKIIDAAFSLYMPQIRSEITALAEFIKWEHSLHKEKYTILEIGTKNGGTLYIWNEINPNGINISIDKSDGGKHGGISEETMDKRDLWFNERFNNCHFIRGNSHDTTTLFNFFDIINPDWKIVKKTEQFRSVENSVDFLFIDGDHTREGVELDFNWYLGAVKPGGCIAFHDIVISDHHHSRDVYVGEFWKKITELKIFGDPNRCIYGGHMYEIHEFVEPGNNWGGIGLLKKIN